MKTSVIALALLMSIPAAFADAPVTLPGVIVGQVEIAPGVPAPGCKVVVSGAPISAPCNNAGSFEIRNMPPGAWQLVVEVHGFSAKVLMAGAMSDQTTSTGTILVGRPGSIAGRVTVAPGQDVDAMVVGIIEFGIFTKPGPKGDYLLTGVPAGAREVYVTNAIGGAQIARRAVNVGEGQLTSGANLTGSPVVVPPGGISHP